MKWYSATRAASTSSSGSHERPRARRRPARRSRPRGRRTRWPTQADPLITLAIGLPNHPSYTSNHAAISTTVARILGSVFPRERKRLAAMADEAGLSRIYGGIHYRFDKTGGEKIARNVSALALRLDVRGHRPFPVKP